MVNFWASWCGPCRDEHPYLLQLNNIKNLNLLGVNFKDNKDNALNFLNEYGNPYDVLAKDESGKQSVNFGIFGIPESILLNKNLVILKKFIGPISENDFRYIKDIVQKKMKIKILALFIILNFNFVNAENIKTGQDQILKI